MRTIRTFEVLLEIARENVRLQREGLQIAEARFRAARPRNSTSSSRTRLLENTLASIPELQTGLQRAKNALSVLLGQPPGGVDSLLHGPQRIPVRLPASGRRPAGRIAAAAARMFARRR